MALIDTAIVLGALYLVARRFRQAERRSASRARARPRPAHRPEPKRSERKSSGNDDLARRIERGEIRGADLRALFESGQIRMKRNPSDSEALETARRLARQFHGTDQGVVVELDPDERRVSRYAVLVGEVPAIEYQPPEQSQRSGAIYRHESGDRGPGQPTSAQRPLLAVDPVTRRPLLVQHKSPMRFSSKRGLVG